VVNKVTNITTGKIENNMKKQLITITDRWNGTQICGGITSQQSDINTLTEE